jgi:hypothetical protein
MGLQEIRVGCEDVEWIHLDQNSVELQELVSRVMADRIP